MANPIIIQLKEGTVVGPYTVTKKLGEGTFGAVYGVKDDKGNEHAMKAESVNEKLPLLKLELHVMQRLKERKSQHMADLIDKGRFEDFNYIVMKFLGKSMQDTKKCGADSHLSLGSAIGSSIQCLEALEELHWAGFLHRDVKPGNFAVGRAEYKELRKVYMLDFGMCRKFVDNNNVMRPPRRKAPFRGTPRYAPVASHLGKEHCRKDDIESWFYMMVDFTNAKLPWKTITEIKEVGECKQQSRQEPLLSTFFAGCPFDEYKEVLAHIDSLGFYDDPNYGLIYKTLRGALKKRNIREFPYDWEILPEKETSLKQ